MKMRTTTKKKVKKYEAEIKNAGKASDKSAFVMIETSHITLCTTYKNRNE